MINMEKCLMMLVFLFLNNLSPSYTFPNANSNAEVEPVPDSDVIIQISPMVNSGSSGSQTLEEVDEHSEGDCSHWSYPSTNWSSMCPQHCDGERQSPIDIVTTPPLPTTGLPFNLDSYVNGPVVASINIKNNGNTAKISLDSSIVHEISDGGLNGNYTLAQIHFHWGCENSRGSEHTVDGQSFAMEMHFVHYKSSYGSFGEGFKHSDGLAVIAIFFNVGVENYAFKPITDNLSRIKAPGTDADITFNQPIMGLLGLPPAFIRYEGSVPTPICNEGVIWSVGKKYYQISQSQMDAFRSLQDHSGNPLCDNYRRVQPLNGRIVSQSEEGGFIE